MHSGGDYFNLDKLSLDQALDKLSYQSFKFLGVKEEDIEAYPSIPTSVNTSFSIAGKMNSLKPITLEFGYVNEVTSTIKVNLSETAISETQETIEKIWVQKKLAELDINYEINKKRLLR